MRKAPPVINALSFDIEDWFHLVDIKSLSDPAGWDRLPSLVEKYTDWIIDTIDQAGVRATFFVLGWVAERHPALVRRIADAGHELASHSHMHKRVDKFSPQAFADDLQRSIDVIEQHSGRKVLGFRAPSFSITPGAEWAFDVMHDLGLAYDASLFPARRGQGGYPCPLDPHTFEKTPTGRPMPVLPMSIMRIGPFKLPFSGGGYLRLLPQAMIRRGFRQIHQRGQPVVVYLHPRDFAPECPRAKMPLHRYFRCYVGMKTSKQKLHMLLDRYRFDTCAAVLGIDQNNTAPGDDTTATQLTGQASSSPH